MNFATRSSGRFYENVDRLRSGLSMVEAGAFDAIEFKCFNEAEAQQLREALSAEERAKVKFTWDFAGGFI